MAFMHYIRWDAIELVNAARLEAYAKSLGLGFFSCEGICPTLPEALTIQAWKKPTEYTTPKSDPAPWYDPAVPASAGFAGVHMLDGANGFNSSTWEAQTNESLYDGGFVSAGRYKTREMTFRALLLGTDLHAIQHGFNWLSTLLHRGNVCQFVDYQYPEYRDALRFWVRYKDEATPPPVDDDWYQGPLVTGHPQTYQGIIDSLAQRLNYEQASLDQFLECEGQRMEFFLRCPDATNVKRLYRYFLNVYCTTGPTVLSAHEMDDQCASPGAWAEVEFTLVAANPFAFQYSVDLAKDSKSYTYKDYLVGTGKTWWAMYKNDVPLSDDNMYEAPLLYRDIQHNYAGILEVLWRKLPPVTTVPTKREIPATRAGPIWTDPDCSPVLDFPGTPAEELLCSPLYTGPWNRTIYRTYFATMPRWTEATLMMEFTSLGLEFQDVRVRLVPDKHDFETGWVVQFYIQSIPLDTTMRIDGRRRSIVLYSGYVGSPQFVLGAASHLVITDSVAASYRYPTIVCGGKYTVVVDVPSTMDVTKLGVKVLAIGREN